MMNIVNSSPSKVNNTNIWGVNSLSQSPHHQHHLSSPLLSRLEDSKTISQEHYDRNSMDQAVLSSNGNGAIGMDLLREIDQNGNDRSPPQHLDNEEFMIRSPIHKNRKSMGNSSGKTNQQILGTPVHHQHTMNMTSPQQNSTTSPLLLSSPPLHISNNWVNEKMFLESKVARLSSELYSAKCEISRLQSQLDEYRQKEMYNSKVNSTSTVGNSPSPTEMNGTNVGLERPLSPASSCTTSSWSGFNNEPIGSTFPGPEKSSPYDNSIYSYMTNPAQQLLISPRKSPTPNNVTTTPGRYNRSNSFGSSGNDLPNTNLMQNNRLSVLATPNRGVNNNQNGLPSLNDSLFPQNINEYQMSSPNRMSMMNPIGMESPINMMTPTGGGNSGSRKYSNNVLINSPFITPNIGGGRIFPTPTTPSPNNLYYNSSIAITPKSTTSSVASNSSASSGTPTLSDASNGAIPTSLIKSGSPILSTTPTSTGGGVSSNSNNSTPIPVINHNKSGDEIVYLLSGGGVGSIKVYDLSKDEFTQAQDNQQQHAKRGYDKHALTDYYLSLKGHSRFVSALHSHQGKICSGSGDNSIRIWNFDTGECEHVLAGCEGKVGALCSYYGNLVSGSKDGNSHRIRAWDVEKAECVKCVHAHSDWINVLCASENTLFSGSGDRKVKVWSGPNFENIMTLDNSSFVLSLVYDPVYNCLVAGTYDGHIRIWDIRSGTKFIKQIKAHSNGVLSLCYHAGLLCSGSKDQTISIYDPKTWNRESQLIGHTDAVKCLVSYQNTWLCSGSYDRTVKLWNLDTASRGSYCTIATGFKNYTLTCHTA